MSDNSLTNGKKVYSVSEITRLIKTALETGFSAVWVEGEVSGLTRAHSGHLYLTIKDANCQLSAVMWRSQAQKIPFELENGQQVVCKGRINVYEPRGQYQLQIELVEPKGKGALQLAFEQLKAKLQKEGLFDQTAKLPLPLRPKKVGIVTSPRGAAIIDILRTLERRFARVHVLIYPAKVQGEGAAREIVAGIEYFNSRRDIDVLIIGRGGGSLEDLWAFNEEVVARAVFNSQIPVISAVGHEIDFTIADFAADFRASTPTAAAELVIETEQSFIDQIAGWETRLNHAIKYQNQELKNVVQALLHHQAFQSFRFRLLNQAQKVDELELRAVSAVQNRQHKLTEIKADVRILEEKIAGILQSKLQTWRNRWEKLGAELHNLSPLNILKKGYSLCFKNEESTPVRSINEIITGEEMMIFFYKGNFSCRVDRINRDASIETYKPKSEPG